MAYIAAITAFVIWGAVSTLLVRYIPLPPPLITTAGFAAGAVALYTWLGSRRHEVRAALAVHGSKLFLLALSGAACSMTYHWAVKTTTVANAVITHSNQALFTCLLFMPLFGQGIPSRRAFLALAVGLAGLTVAFWDEFAPGTRPVGIVIGLTSAVFYGWYNVQIPFFSGKVARDVTICCALILGALIMLPCAFAIWSAGLFEGFEWRPLTARSIAALCTLGVLNYAIASLLYLYAAQRAQLSHVSILANVEPIIGAGAGALFLGEAITTNVIAGGALVLFSSAIIVHDGMRTKTD